MILAFALPSFLQELGGKSSKLIPENIDYDVVLNPTQYKKE